MGFRFQILGPLSVSHDGVDSTPTAPKVRQVLSLLLVRKNQIVQVSEFVDELWSDRPPDSALTTLQTYVYKLRKDLLEPSGLAKLHTQPAGYLLDVPEDDVDISCFERLSTQGRSALEKGDPARATDLLTQALGLWRGHALVGVTAGDILSAYVTRIEENRLRALELRIEADMQMGRHQELISELKQLIFHYPLHERFHGDLMTALHQSGRRYEALEVYRRLRTMLVDELGLEPSAQMQRLHQLLLSADGDALKNPGPATGPIRLAERPAPTPAGGVPLSSLSVPAQLPPDTADFAGRAAALQRIRSWLQGRGEAATTSRAVAISGMAGIGKTTLALQAAHLERSGYPEGQLYADLRGSSAKPAQPADVLAGFLWAVGVPAAAIPATVDERSKLFRTWSADRQVLLVLDDAGSTAQVAPLLPAGGGCRVLVTSRMTIQAVAGVQTLELDVMSTNEAVELLARIIGQARVAEEPEHACTIAELCGHLPLAVRCIGARLATMQNWTLEKMATLLQRDPARLDQLRYAGYDVRAVYHSSYARLDPVDRSTFRLLSLLPPQQFTAGIAASLLGTSTDNVEAQLNRLVASHLLGITNTEAAEPQYHLHKLTRLYGQERLQLEYLDPASGE